MRVLVLITVVAALAGCGSQAAADHTCPELVRDADKRRVMTDAVQDATGRDRDIARAAWETVCANATDAQRPTARPYQPAVDALNSVG